MQVRQMYFPLLQIHVSKMTKQRSINRKHYFPCLPRVASWKYPTTSSSRLESLYSRWVLSHRSSVEFRKCRGHSEKRSTSLRNASFLCWREWRNDEPLWVFELCLASRFESTTRVGLLENVLLIKCAKITPMWSEECKQRESFRVISRGEGFSNYFVDKNGRRRINSKQFTPFDQLLLINYQCCPPYSSKHKICFTLFGVLIYKTK